MKEMNWKEEAQKQASAAGTLKMQLAARMDDIITRILILRKDAETENDPNILYCILNRISMYEDEKRWLSSILALKGDDDGREFKMYNRFNR